MRSDPQPGIKLGPYTVHVVLVASCHTNYGFLHPRKVDVGTVCEEWFQLMVQTLALGRSKTSIPSTSVLGILTCSTSTKYTIQYEVPVLAESYTKVSWNTTILKIVIKRNYRNKILYDSRTKRARFAHSPQTSLKNWNGWNDGPAICLLERTLKMSAQIILHGLQHTVNLLKWPPLISDHLS